VQVYLNSRAEEIPVKRVEPPFEVLLAEDNPADVRLVREAFKEHQLDCTLHVVRDGALAIEFLRSLDRAPIRRRLDLMLLDMHLPKRDGEEILASLRSTEHYARTPVIVMTASDAPRDHEQARKHAAQHYFRKPSSLHEFLTLGAVARAILAGGRAEEAEERVAP
jgi:two-component system, chemotaxis family, response regulator Rcp1